MHAGDSPSTHKRAGRAHASAAAWLTLAALMGLGAGCPERGPGGESGANAGAARPAVGHVNEIGRIR